MTDLEKKKIEIIRQRWAPPFYEWNDPREYGRRQGTEHDILFLLKMLDENV